MLYRTDVFYVISFVAGVLFIWVILTEMVRLETQEKSTTTL